MAETIQLAIVGLGLVGIRHARAIQQVKDVALTCVVDPSQAGRAYAEEHDLAWFDALPTMLATTEVDGVILATPTPLHVDQAMACVNKGLPVLVEKPLATSADTASALVAAAKAAQVPLLVGHHRRHNPLIQKARAVIEAGEIGQVRAVHTNCWFYKPDHYFDDAPWRKLKGAGPVSVNLVHDVDLIRYLCGEIVSVQAHAKASARGYENEDVAAALLRFENGAIGTITVSDSIVSPWSWELTSREYPIYPPTSQSCYLIGGSEGSLSVPDLTLWTHQSAPDWWNPINATTLPRDSSDPLINQIAHFAEIIAGRQPPLVSGMEGLKTLRVIEAIQSSAATGKAVEIQEIAAGQTGGRRETAAAS